MGQAILFQPRREMRGEQDVCRWMLERLCWRQTMCERRQVGFLAFHGNRRVSRAAALPPDGLVAFAPTDVVADSRFRLDLVVPTDQRLAIAPLAVHLLIRPDACLAVCHENPR